jgi:hypothetical protein
MAPKRPKSYDPTEDQVGDEIWVDDYDPTIRYDEPGESDEYYSDEDDDLYNNIDHASRSAKAGPRMGDKEKRRRSKLYKDLGREIPKEFQTVDSAPKVVTREGPWEMPKTLSPNEVASMVPGRATQQAKSAKTKESLKNIRKVIESISSRRLFNDPDS